MATKRIERAEDDVKPGGAAWQVAVNGGGGEEQPTGEEIETAEEFAVIDRIRTTLAQSGDGVSVKLFRVNALTKKREFCQNYAPEDLENVEERIREQWGAGAYEVKIFNSRGIAPGGRIMLTLAAPTKPVQSAPAVPDAVAQMLAAMVANQNAMMEAVANLSARINAAPVPAPHEQMKATIELLSMVKALAPTPAPAPATNQAEMMREVFSMIREAKSAVRELSEDDPPSDPDNPMTMVREFLQTARGVMGQQTPAIAAPVPHIAIPQSFDNQEKGEDMFNLQKHVAELESMLQRGEDPEAGAQYLYKWLPASFLPMLAGDSWFAIVGTASSILANNREWCDKVRSRAIALFDEAKKQGLL